MGEKNDWSIRENKANSQTRFGSLHLIVTGQMNLYQVRAGMW